MNKDKGKIRNIVFQLLVESYGINSEELDEGKTFDDLGVDSIVIMDFQVDLERDLEIDIPDGSILPAFNFEALVEYLFQLSNKEQ